MLPEQLEPKWVAYRLVAEGWCTLADLDQLTFDDILDANDVLDAVIAARAQR